MSVFPSQTQWEPNSYWHPERVKARERTAAEKPNPQSSPPSLNEWAERLWDFHLEADDADLIELADRILDLRDEVLDKAGWVR